MSTSSCSNENCTSVCTSSSAATRRASGDAQYDATKPAISCSSSSVTRGNHARTRSRSTTCGFAQVDRLEQAMHGVADVERAEAVARRSA